MLRLEGAFGDLKKFLSKGSQITSSVSPELKKSLEYRSNVHAAFTKLNVKYFINKDILKSNIKFNLKNVEDIEKSFRLKFNDFVPDEAIIKKIGRAGEGKRPEEEDREIERVLFDAAGWFEGDAISKNKNNIKGVRKTDRKRA